MKKLIYLWYRVVYKFWHWWHWNGGTKYQSPKPPRWCGCQGNKGFDDWQTKFCVKLEDHWRMLENRFGL